MEAPASLRPALSHCLFPDHYPCNYPSPHPADFLRALSAAIFINVHEDVEALQNWHGAGGPGTMTPAQLAAQGPAYYNRRVRRMVRAAEPLKASLQQLLDDWRDVCDPTTGYKLLRPQTDLVHQAVIALIDGGSFCGAFRKARGVGRCCYCTWLPKQTPAWRCETKRLQVPDLSFSALPARRRPLWPRQDVHHGGRRAGPHVAATTTT